MSALAAALSTQAAEYHVAKNGKDSNKGSKRKPLLTIQAAAELAQAGDSITVHEGICRERVSPPRGGTSDEQRITYQAAAGERVEIKGSELVTGWESVRNDAWRVVLPNSFFGEFNPYSDVLDGHWFRPRKRVHHTGSVYLNGVWRMEAAWLDTANRPVVTAGRLGKTAVGNLPYERADGSPVKVDKDVLGAARNKANTMPGPVEAPGHQQFKRWPIRGK
jgi:hypothetical protein